MADRRIFRLHGPDTHSFLQGVVTNDINRLEDGLVYTAILTPQGKYLADFFDLGFVAHAVQSLAFRKLRHFLPT